VNDIERKKNMKKIIALVLVAVMIMAIAVTANAASITINRDSSFDTSGQEGAGNVYKYYKVFSASYTSNTSTGGGSTDGEPGAVNASAENASYTATSAVAAKLGSWTTPVYYTAEDTIPEGKNVGDLKSGGWTRASGNEWFDLSPIVGTNNYNVAWANANDNAATVQAAAAWLIENEAYENGPTALTFDESAKAWKSEANIDAGYYLVEGATGKNLVAATTDVTINEKNTYPPLDKTQSDEDNTTKNNEARDVAIGDVLNYDVTVTIPATAKVGDKILVYDNKSEGLTFNNDITVTNTAKATVGESDYSGTGAVEGATWQRLITVDDDTVLGSTVVFSFTMTVNASALVDTDKGNESALKYGPGSGETPWPFEGKPDKVEYKTYFAGIHKIDGDTSNDDLAGVEFTLKEGGTAFYVKKDGTYYIPCASTDTGATTTVVTDSEGRIMIRGLDEDKTYTLTETKTLDGYNMLTTDVTLSLYEDTHTVTTTDGEGTSTTTTTESFDPSKTNEKWGVVENHKGSVLPSTGGIGTTIFYILGAILVIGAGVVLVTRRRMSAN